MWTAPAWCCCRRIRTRSARALRAALRERLGLDVAVIVSDTMGRPWRNGLTDVALGAAGIDAVRDHRGRDRPVRQRAAHHPDGGRRRARRRRRAGQGQADQVPVAVVRGYLPAPDGALRAGRGRARCVLVRDAAQDLFSLGTAEARAAGLRDAAALGLVGAIRRGTGADTGRGRTGDRRGRDRVRRQCPLSPSPTRRAPRCRQARPSCDAWPIVGFPSWSSRRAVAPACDVALAADGLASAGLTTSRDSVTRGTGRPSGTRAAPIGAVSRDGGPRHRPRRTGARDADDEQVLEVACPRRAP